MARRPSARAKPRGQPRKRDYAAEYARRVAGTPKGSPERQRKRGHAPPPGRTEYQVRAERERFEDTTTSQRAAIRRWAREQALRNRTRGESVDHAMSRAERFATTMIAKVAERPQGYEEFKAMTAELRRMRRERSHRGKVLVLAGRAANIAAMEEFADEWDIDLEWLLYN